MIDTTAERLVSLADVTKQIPPARGGKRTHISTILRWILTGCKDANGNTVRLEAVRCGSRWLTSKESLQRFMERLTPQLDGEQVEMPRSPAERRRSSDRAEKQLARMGI